MNQVTIKSIDQASKVLEGVSKKTPLQFNSRLSQQYNAKIYLKREDLQTVRSYKIRGAYTKMNTLSPKEKKNGVVCASAGNHAQGIALSASKMKVKATIFMPQLTPLQKVNKVKTFGGDFVDIKLVGTTFDESAVAAREFAHKHHCTFIPPFDDESVISGQGTVGKEILEEMDKKIDIVICPIGGGGLIAGVSTYLKAKDQKINIIGVEPKGAAGMFESFQKGHVVTLDVIDTFVDGAAVKTVGQKTFEICDQNIQQIILVPEGKVCTTMIELYQNEGIVTEPAGALSISALDAIASQIEGKRIVCIISGGNNDILRYPEIMERSLIYQGLKHYFLIEFAQTPGQLKQFVNKALGESDDIVRFEYIKKSAKEKGPALVGIELSQKDDYEKLLERMDTLGIKYTIIKDSDILYTYLI